MASECGGRAARENRGYPVTENPKMDGAAAERQRSYAPMEVDVGRAGSSYKHKLWKAILQPEFMQKQAVPPGR